MPTKNLQVRHFSACPTIRKSDIFCMSDYPQNDVPHRLKLLAPSTKFWHRRQNFGTTVNFLAPPSIFPQHRQFCRNIVNFSRAPSIFVTMTIFLRKWRGPEDLQSQSAR